MRDKIEKKVTTVFPQVNSFATERIKELQSIKQSIRQDPEKVELWFDNEIKKINHLNFTELMQTAFKLIKK